MKKIYPSQHPDLVRARNAEYREKNREKLKQYDAERYAKRYAERKARGQTKEEKEAARARAREWRKKNPEAAKESTRAWHEANPGYLPPSALDREKVNEKWRAAYAARADHYREMARRKRIKRADVPGVHTQKEWLDLVEYFGGCCAYCGKSGKMTRDHVIPMSRKELSPTDAIENILPACRSCNSRKKDKTDWEFRRWLYDNQEKACRLLSVSYQPS